MSAEVTSNIDGILTATVAGTLLCRELLALQTAAVCLASALQIVRRGWCRRVIASLGFIERTGRARDLSLSNLRAAWGNRRTDDFGPCGQSYRIWR
jgi:hypothetical protein